MRRVPPPCFVRRAAGRAFTLVELLLAIAIMAMLLVALLTFVFSMGEIWGQGREKRLFEQHVNAVTRHVEGLFRHAALPLGLAAAAEPFAIRQVQTAGSGSRPLLSLDLPEGDRILPWAGPPLPEVRCALTVEPGQGLVVYWQSVLETRRDTEPPRRHVVSPLVSGVRYFYADGDTGRWDERPDLQRAANGSWLVPDRIQLSFTYAGATLERTITLPVSSGALPAF